MNQETKNTTQNKKFFDKINAYFHSKKWKELWDKITTGILIALMISPFAILTYIIAWFLCK